MTLVWIALVVALLAMFAIFAIVLFRKVIAVLQEFSDLVGRTAILDGVHRAEPEERPLPAAIGGVDAAASRWRHRRHRSRERAAERRRLRIARAHRLIDANADSIEWFRR